MDHVLQHFAIPALDKAGWRRARAFPMPDFEDAAVAITAEDAGAAFIVTRNEPDFANSPVRAINPASFPGRFMPTS